VIPIKDNIPVDRLGLATLGLILATLVRSFVAPAGWSAAAEALRHGHRPAAALGELLVQRSPIALAVNLLFLWLFGSSVEDSMGPLRFIGFYAAGGLAALALQVVIDPDGTGRIAGAAGAIAAVIGGYLVLYPRGRVLTLSLIPLFAGVVEIPVTVMLALWVAAQAVLTATGLTDPGGAAGYLAYAGGLLFGVAAIRATARRRRPTPPTAAAWR
jgi:membrane associated rhomboid family serine protease